MTQVETQTQKVPLNKLEVAPENSRKTNVTARQDELKASIQTYGLLQPLLIRPAKKKGHFFVVDGQRRLLAMKALVKDKALKTTFSVKCEEIDPEKALELSLTANVQVQTMHPADQFEAFFEMSKNKMSAGDIAARFGVSEQVVKQRLKLANVSPKLLELYRQAEMTLEHLEAFTLTDDHKKQETIWSELPEWQKNARQIKAILTETKIKSSDPRVEFITLEAYENAGGHAEYDLFSEDVFLTDLELVDTLIAQKISDAAKAVEAEGWSFVEVAASYDHMFLNEFNRTSPETIELEDKDKKRFEEIEKEIEQLEEDYFEAENQDELNQKISDLEAEYEVLIKKTKVFTAEQKQNGGAYVAYRHGGIDIVRGLTTAQEPEIEQNKEPKPKKEISERLMEQLTAHKTLALQDMLSKSPQIAYDLMLTEMVRETFSDFSRREHSCFHLKMREASFPDGEDLKNSFARANREKAFEKWEKIISPDSETQLYETISSLNKNQKNKLLAFCFSGSLDAVFHPKEYISQKQKDKVNELADLLKLDMTQYWKPSASLYFNHITKDNILNVIREVKGLDVADALRKLKKSDLAKAVEKRLEDTGWLPKPLKVGVHSPEK